MLALDDDVRREIVEAVDPRHARRVERNLAQAAEAYERGRFGEARKILSAVADVASAVPSFRELMGLCHYRLGRWREAIRELEAFRMLAGTVEQHPVLADCYRAIGRHDEVERLFRELSEGTGDPELVEEGRIVLAGSLVDRGRVREAVELLSRDFPAKKIRRSSPIYMLRRAYALADALERAGELPRARRLFSEIARAAPDLTDADERARDLS
ncbi:MAG: hypothetical protein KatS3mg008_0345 [Acidimicrobiales bacterium]|nr:MAG: hypothetical protein KatS3mg008_0345 [Acidimicrobiales bacterium]